MSALAMTPTRADVLLLVAEGRNLGDYVPRYARGARRGRGAFPVTIAMRAERDLREMGLVEFGPSGSVLTAAGAAEVERIRTANRAGPIDLSDLGLASTQHAGVVFETGRPVTFPFVHNTEGATKPRREAFDPFQQRIEPAGFYMIADEDPGAPLARGWIRGTASFRSPIVLAWNTGEGGYDERSWKARLSRAYGRRTGVALSRAIQRDGHDAIVTVDESGTSEILDVTRVRGASNRARGSEESPTARALRAAHEILSEGRNSATTTEVAKRAGVSVRAAYEALSEAERRGLIDGSMILVRTRGGVDMRERGAGDGVGPIAWQSASPDGYAGELSRDL